MAVAAVEVVGERAIPLAVLAGAACRADRPGPRVRVTPRTGYFQARMCTVRPSIFTVVARVDRLEHVFGTPVRRALGLLCRCIEVLLEVALPVQQRDADDRHATVGGERSVSPARTPSPPL